MDLWVPEGRGALACRVDPPAEECVDLHRQGGQASCCRAYAVKEAEEDDVDVKGSQPTDDVVGTDLSVGSGRSVLDFVVSLSVAAGRDCWLFSGSKLDLVTDATGDQSRVG